MVHSFRSWSVMHRRIRMRAMLTASLEETVKKDGEERVLASLKQVGVSMAVFFNEPEEGKEE